MYIVSFPLGTLLAYEVHDTLECFILAIMSGPSNRPSPRVTGRDQRTRDEPPV